MSVGATITRIMTIVAGINYRNDLKIGDNCHSSKNCGIL